MAASLQQAGDTIIEVMISIAIIGVVLAGAYVGANRSYLTIFGAQQREEATLLAQKQVEIMYKNGSMAKTAANNLAGASSSFCFYTNGSGQLATVANTSLTAPNTDCKQGANNLYTVAITRKSSPQPPALSTYQVEVTWVPTQSRTAAGSAYDDVYLFYQPENG